jgi:hypothetical protein
MKYFAVLLVSSLFAVAAAGCAGNQSQNGGGVPLGGSRVLPPAVAQQLSLTMAHYVQLPVHPDQRPSRMQPDAGKKSALIYAADDATNDVYVYDYKSGTQVGTLTGFSAPYGMCVDAKGDVYIVNFGAGDVVEYSHGGKKLKTFESGGEPIGCSVDAKNDLAVTSFSRGEVVIFFGGNPSKSATYSGSCTYMWSMGYDDKKNLVGIGEQSTGSIVACALLSGSKSMITLSGCCQGPITIDFPGGTVWDGKYLALGDQEAGGTFTTGLARVTLSGTTLSPHGETVLTDTCYSDYADVVNPFIVGEKNTPLNRKEGRVVIGANLWCNDAGGGFGIEFWHYPAGGNPFKKCGDTLAEPYGAALSLKA